MTQAAGQAAQGAAGAGSAWEARIGAEAVRVEAAADPGRRLEFVVRPLTRPRPVLATEREAFQPLLAVFVAGFVLGGLALVAVLARHNLRLGRGDRRGANRLAVAVTAAETLFVVLGRHWTYEPIALIRVIMLLLGLPLFTGIQTWLYYMALEPAMRRRWPRLLIAWTRLLEGR